MLSSPFLLLFAGFGVAGVFLMLLIIALVVGRRRGPEQSTFYQPPHSLPALPYPLDMNQGIHTPPTLEGHHYHHHEPGFAPPPMHHAPPPPDPPPMHHHPF